MKKLIVLFALLSASAFAGTAVNGKIHFQKESTWVSMMYSKSLCFDGRNFRAKIKKCTQTTGRNDLCTSTRIVNAVQPKYSTTQRCVRSNRSRCLEYRTVDYIQQETRRVRIEADRGGRHTYKTVTVRSCN